MCPIMTVAASRFLGLLFLPHQFPKLFSSISYFGCETKLKTASVPRLEIAADIQSSSGECETAEVKAMHYWPCKVAVSPLLSGSLWPSRWPRNPATALYVRLALGVIGKYLLISSAIAWVIFSFPIQAICPIIAVGSRLLGFLFYRTNFLNCVAFALLIPLTQCLISPNLSVPLLDENIESDIHSSVCGCY